MMHNILVDTCIWIAFADDRDSYENRDNIDALYDLIKDNSIVLPWPIMYETLRTRLARNHIALSKMETELKSPRITWIDDAPYRQEALELTFQSGLREHRALSMVDCLVRLILDDRNHAIHYLATWNERDFDDVCRNRRIDIIGLD
jgi:predicted nucleic acid-binding protein